jgi:carboxymethylenebutenolidase
MNQKIIKLFDEYTHKPLTRSIFLEKLLKLTGSTLAMNMALSGLEGNYASAEIVPENDPDLKTEWVSFISNGKEIKGYLVMPKKLKKKVGAVMVVHENRGLTPHIKDLTRRVAKAGYISMGIDALSEFGGTPSNEDEGRGLIAKLDPKANLENMLAGLDFLRNHKKANGRTAVVGFCWGGAMANTLAVNDSNLNAAVAYYGRQAAVEEVSRIKAALLLHYAEQDDRVNAGMAAFESALKKEKKTFQAFVYPGVQHAFNNDSSPARYNKEAADLAWSRTLEHFKKYLS